MSNEEGVGGIRQFFPALAVALLVASLGGCSIEPADPPTLATWQRNLEKYVWDRGNGDPNVLADMSWDDMHKGFAVIGDPLPDRATDQIGLLLAHRMLGGKPWFIFLLGTVSRQHLQDLRPVALQMDGAAFGWSVGNGDPTSLSLYRAWSQADRQRDGRRDPPAPPFPRPREMFEVTVEDDHFLIRHPASGAQWELRPAISPATIPANAFRESNQAKS